MKADSKYSRLAPKNPIGRAIAVSLAIHALVMSILILWPTGESSASITPENVMVARLVRLGREPDKKALPRKDPAVSVDSGETVDVDTDIDKPTRKELEKEKNRQQDEFAKKLASSINKVKKDMDRTSARIEQAIGSPNGSVNGDSNTEGKGDPYLTGIYTDIRRNYVVPSIITESERKTLQATIIIYLDEDGNLLKLSFEKRSGNIHFDNALESAVKRTSPFSPPPAERRRPYRDQGIGLKFSIAD